MRVARVTEKSSLHSFHKYLYSNTLTFWAFSKLISRCKCCLSLRSIGKPSGTWRKNGDFRRVVKSYQIQ